MKKTLHNSDDAIAYWLIAGYFAVISTIAAILT